MPFDCLELGCRSQIEGRRVSTYRKKSCRAEGLFFSDYDVPERLARTCTGACPHSVDVAQAIVPAATRLISAHDSPSCRKADIIRQDSPQLGGSAVTHAGIATLVRLRRVPVCRRVVERSERVRR